MGEEEEACKREIQSRGAFRGQESGVKIGADWRRVMCGSCAGHPRVILMRRVSRGGGSGAELRSGVRGEVQDGAAGHVGVICGSSVGHLRVLCGSSAGHLRVIRGPAGSGPSISSPSLNHFG